MAGNVSPKDLQTLQDGLVDGMITPDNLPGNVRDAVFQYMGTQGIDMTSPDSDLTQAQLAQLKQQREAQDGGIFDSKIFKPIEWVGSKLYQFYSATVSPALSAGVMAAHSIVYGRPDEMRNESEWDVFQDYWKYSHNISPGQAVWMLGLSNEELKKRGIDWKTAADQEIAQREGVFKGAISKEDPFGVQTNLDKYFGSGASKYVSGTTDLAVSWYADPLVLGGKVAGAAKIAKFTRPVEADIKFGEKVVLKGNPQLTPELANKMAWDNFTRKQPFQSLTDHFMNIKRSNPDTATAVMLREPTLRKSANGPAVAALLNQAKDQTEVANVLRVTFGDQGAWEALKVQNGELAYQIKQLTSRKAAVSTFYNGLSDADKISPMGIRSKALLDAQTADLAKLDSESQIITDKMNAYGTLGDLNFNRITTPAGTKIRNTWEQSRDWRPLSDGGFIKATVNNAYSLSLGGVVKIAHAYGDIKPSHYIDIHDADGYKQLNASLMEAKHLTPQARDTLVSEYLNASEAARSQVLQSIEQRVTHGMVDRYNARTGSNIDYDVADALYREVAQRRGAAQGSMSREQFGTAQVDNPDLPGTKIRVDEIAPDGGKVVVTPLLRSQMANSHVMLDFKLFQKALDANASSWQAAKLRVGNGWTKAVGLADYVGQLWKFSQLFRLGYGPRALSDDALGQVARFGLVDMMTRSVQGGKYSLEALRRAAMPDGALEAAHVARSHIEFEIDDLVRQQTKIERQLADARREGRTLDEAAFRSQLDINTATIADRRTTLADMDSIVKGGANYKHAKLNGEIFDPSYAGVEGGLFRDLASGDKNFQNMMGSVADGYINQTRRMNWEQLSPAKHGEDVHMDAWLKVLNQQVANDQLAVQYLKGKSPAQLEAWLNTAEGQAYKRGHRIAKLLPHDQLVERVASQVDEWVNRAFPAGDAIRQAAAKGEVTREMLEGVPVAARPLVNGRALEYARGSHAVMQLIDHGMSQWYRFMGQLPAVHLLRNPLFAQRYKVYLGELMDVAGKSGTTHMTEDLRTQIQSAARKRALNDVKKNTFTMDYETRMSYMLRNFGAFFGAQQESWNRWARIISDKPDILGRIATVMGAPTRAGITTDQNGYRIDADGYITDPTTGERRLVPYNDRHIVIQVPDYLGGKAFKKFFGLDKDATFDVPMSTANIILNHGDGPIPVSAGPYVQIAANKIAANSPKVADTFQQLGVLPFGVSDSNLETFLPNWWRKGEAGTDETSDTYQKQLWYIMQAENYKYRQGLRKTEPTWPEINKRAKHQAYMKTLFAAVLPISLQAKDPYEFFRQQYKAMQSNYYSQLDAYHKQKEANPAADIQPPQDVDQLFYDKFGDSALVFTQSLTKNNSGLRPTAEAVHLSKYYQDLISKVGPEWAGLIAGAEQEGVYSQGAYHYLTTHPIDPASGETAITKMSAREALEQSDLAKGWTQYKSQMNTIYARLYAAGFHSFDDPGAEDFKAQKQALVKVLSDPQIVDDNGNLVANNHYNAAWSKAYNSLDVNYFDRQAVNLKQIVNDPEIWSKAVNPDGSIGMRSDIYRLKAYLAYRDDAKRALIMRKLGGGSDDINAQQNADIKQQWNAMVVDMIQQDTLFGDLFNRYLSRDMGFDRDTVMEQQATGMLSPFQGNALGGAEEAGAEGQSIFDVMSEQGSIGGRGIGSTSFDNTSTFGG